MKTEIWTKPEIADEISENGLRVIHKTDLDENRNEEFPNQGDHITIACYRGNGHYSHMFDATYKVMYCVDGKAFRIRKLPSRRPKR